MMINKNPWDVIRSGNLKQGLDLMREGYRLDPSPSRIMQLGIAYLFTRDYQAAVEHFQRAIEQYPRSLSGFYGMAGAAKWCINEPNASVSYWRSGLEADYADGAGGIHLPLLLFLASILRPDTFSTNEAEQLLMRKIEDPRVKNWPGPLAQFVLHRIDQKTLEALSIDTTKRETPAYRTWLIRFYNAVLKLAEIRVKQEHFKQLIIRMADIAQPEWLEEENFVRLLWTEEFFLARHEAFLK